MIGRAILLGTFALLGIASLRTEPLQISEAQQVTSTPTRTPTATGSSTPSVTITPSASQTPTVTVTVAPAPTSTSLPTLNRIPPAGTLTVIRLPTLVPTATRTPTRTPTPSPTRSVTPTASRTPTVTITGTATTTVAPTSTPTSLPAVIVDLATTSLTRSSATVTWSTNAPATSQVEYTNAAGTTIRSTVDPSLVSAHRVVLVGLQPGTTYRFGARSFTADGVETVSQDATFTTAATGSGPEVANPHVSQATGTTATVEWATSTGTVAQVEYGRGANYGSFTLLKIFATPTQSMTLVDLKPATVYHFRVKAWDGQGQLAASSDGIFSTAPSGQATLIGDDTMQTDYLTLPGGQAAAFQYVAAQSGQASVLHLFVESGTTAPMVRAALYTDQDGTPGTILTQGSAPALVTGWINVSIPPVSLLQGTRYWLIVLSPLGAGSLNVRQAALGGSSLASAQASLAAFPQPFVAGAPGARSPLSAYVQQVPPAITLTGPPDGSVVSGPVQLSAVVDDDVALSRVQFFVDGVPVGAPLSKAPYTVAWDSAGLNTDLPHTISARASDVAGRSSASGMVSVQVDNGPRIADVSFGPGLTASSARVTWTTDVPSDAQVEYGPTTTYGLVTPVDSRLDARHDMQLTSLAADGVYHYRVRSRDANGALAVSPDAVFYTAPSP